MLVALSPVVPTKVTRDYDRTLTQIVNWYRATLVILDVVNKISTKRHEIKKVVGDQGLWQDTHSNS